MAIGKRKVALDDSTSDDGWKVPGGRQEVWWRTRKTLDTKRLGVQKIRDDRWLHDIDEGIARFRLRSVEFGNWMNDADRRHWYYGAMLSLENLATILDVQPGKMGFDGKLSIALGARGVGGKAVAHYEPRPHVVINITKVRGDGSFAHEYGHAIDNFAGETIGKNWASGGMTVFTGIDEGRLEKQSVQALIERAYQEVMFDGKKMTMFGASIKNYKGDRAEYFLARAEIWARMFEAWVAQQCYRRRILNGWLVNGIPAAGKTFLYPSLKDSERATKVILAVAGEVFSEIPESSEQEATVSPKATSVHTSTGEIVATYAVVELDSLVTSHDPDTWSPDHRYPNNCQQRDYTRDKGEQLKVDRGAKKLQPRLLLTDTPSALDGPPIVKQVESDDRTANIVLGGNGRSMMLRKSIRTKTYPAYRKALLASCGHFGLDRGVVDTYTQPVLVRIVDVDIRGNKCAYFSNLLNTGLTQGIDHTTESFALARQLPEAALDMVAEIIGEAQVETMSELFSNVRVSRAIIGVLRKARVITDTNASEYLTRTGEVSDSGRLRIQTILLGALLKDARLAELAKTYTLAILRTAPQLMQIRKLGDQWDLMPILVRAIEAESERRAAGVPREQFLRQTSFVRDSIDQDTQTVWGYLDRGARKFAEFVNTYLKRAQTESQGDGFGFHEPLDRSGVIASTTSGLAGNPMLATDIARRQSQRRRPLAFSGRWQDFLGEDIVAPVSMLLWGQKNNGKSTMLLQLADELGTMGTVYLNSAEEPPDSPTLLHRIEQTGLALRNVYIDSVPWPEMIRRVSSGQYDWILVDSIQHLAQKTPEHVMLDDWDSLRNRMSWVFVGRSDKAKQMPAGRASWGYAVDIDIHVKDFTGRLIKHRYLDPRQLSQRTYNILQNR